MYVGIQWDSWSTLTKGKVIGRGGTFNPMAHPWSGEADCRTTSLVKRETYCLVQVGDPETRHSEVGYNGARDSDCGAPGHHVAETRQAGRDTTKE